MNVAVFSEPIDTQYAGISFYTQYLINELTKNEGVNNIYCIRNSIDAKIVSREQIIEVRGRNNPFSRFCRAFFASPKALKMKKLDIVIEPAHFGPFNLPKSIKRVTVIHDLTPIIKPSWHPLASVLAHRLLLKRILRKADLIVTNSEFTKSDIIKYYPFTHKLLLNSAE